MKTQNLRIFFVAIALPLLVAGCETPAPRPQTGAVAGSDTSRTGSSLCNIRLTQPSALLSALANQYISYSFHAINGFYVPQQAGSQPVNVKPGATEIDVHMELGGGGTDSRKIYFDAEPGQDYVVDFKRTISRPHVTARRGGQPVNCTLTPNEQQQKELAQKTLVNVAERKSGIAGPSVTNRVPSASGKDVEFKWLVLDMEKECDVFEITIRFFGYMTRADVIVQVSNDPTFAKDTRTIWNSDKDGSLGLGTGSDPESRPSREGDLVVLPFRPPDTGYAAYSDGTTLKFRYLRVLSLANAPERTGFKILGRPKP